MDLISPLELAIKVIEQLKRPLSAAEIWDEAKKLGLDSQVEIKSDTPWKTIQADIYFNINNSLDPLFYLFDSNPPRYYLNTLPPPQIDAVVIKTESEKKYPYLEIDLHPLLIYYIFTHPNFKCYAKTINHTSSVKEKKGSNLWVYPDIVGIRFPFKDLSLETRNLMQAFEYTTASFYSFELKRDITRSNIREYFFQAVSNSSWANEGYLVTKELDMEDEDLENEIRRLSNSFGIGVIQLNPESIPDSTIISPSRRKNDLDWSTINRIGDLNNDFKIFMSHVTEGMKGSVPKPELFDEVMDSEKLNEHCKKKGIIVSPPNIWGE
ncbi:MAG: HTH domain-containing protein [Methanomicrobiales archaeon]|nr:HTH domain-containing protein [Methanomicrobiales archaeon]